MERLLAQLNTKEIKKQLIGLGELKSWLESHSISVSDVATIKQGDPGLLCVAFQPSDGRGVVQCLKPFLKSRNFKAALLTLECVDITLEQVGSFL